MPGPGPIDRNHAAPRSFLRIAGPLALLAGLGFLIVGLVDFFSCFGTFRFPTLAWCPFVGMPLIFIGVVMTLLGYMGRMARYVSEETTPVGTDTFNYAVHETKGSVRDLAQAVGDGLRGVGPATPAELACPRCHQANEPGARFCAQCGSPLAGGRACPKCRHENDLNAHFCDNCGQALDTVA
jgi:hypothetical protein